MEGPRTVGELNAEPDQDPGEREREECFDGEEFVGSYRLGLLESPVMVPNGDNDARTEGEKCSYRPCSDGPVAR